MTKVLVCDQKSVSGFLMLIHKMLEQEPDLQVHDHCVLPEVPRLANELEPDVIVFVTGFPKPDEQDLIRKHRSDFPEAKLVAMSLGASIPGYTEPLKEAGVDRIVPAEEALDLPRHIREVVSH